MNPEKYSYEYSAYFFTAVLANLLVYYKFMLQLKNSKFWVYLSSKPEM